MKKRSPSFLILLASVSLISLHPARAETTSDDSDIDAIEAVDADMADETIDLSDENATDATMAVADAAATKSCVDGGICVGMYAKVTSGDFVGEEGAVVGIDDSNATATLVNARGDYAYPLLTDLTSQSAPNWDGCFAGVCIGDKVKLLSGKYLHKKGRVAGIDSVHATAIVLVKRKYYVTIAIADLKVKRREVYDTPYPERRYYRTYRDCGYDRVFDVYRGCAHIVRIYHPIPPRVIIVHRGPIPRPRPVIIHRPGNPPHHPDGPPSRGPFPIPSRPQRPPMPSHGGGNSGPFPGSSGPSRPSGAPQRPSMPSHGGGSSGGGNSSGGGGGGNRPGPGPSAPSRPSGAPQRPSMPHH